MLKQEGILTRGFLLITFNGESQQTHQHHHHQHQTNKILKVIGEKQEGKGQKQLY